MPLTRVASRAASTASCCGGRTAPASRPSLPEAGGPDPEAELVSQVSDVLDRNQDMWTQLLPKHGTHGLVLKPQAEPLLLQVDTRCRPARMSRLRLALAQNLADLWNG